MEAPAPAVTGAGAGVEPLSTVRTDKEGDSTWTTVGSRGDPWAKLVERILDSPVLVRRTVLVLLASTPTAVTVILVLLVGR